MKTYLIAWIAYLIGSLSFWYGSHFIVRHPKHGFWMPAGVALLAGVCWVFFKPRPIDYSYLKINDQQSLRISFARMIPITLLMILFSSIVLANDSSEPMKYFLLSLSAFYLSFIRMKFVHEQEYQ